VSPRAAARLEALGYGPLYDYVDGKADWGSAGLPLEGHSGSQTRAGAHLRADVPTCGPEDALSVVRSNVSEAGWDTCFVLNDEGVLLGRLEGRALASEQDVPAVKAMTEGPSTVRPSARLRAIVDRMQRQNLSDLPVTTLDGRFVGLLLRTDAEQAVRSLT
jgi:CBS domain-containing protein